MTLAAGLDAFDAEHRVERRAQRKQLGKATREASAREMAAMQEQRASPNLNPEPPNQADMRKGRRRSLRARGVAGSSAGGQRSCRLSCSQLERSNTYASLHFTLTHPHLTLTLARPSR